MENISTVELRTPAKFEQGQADQYLVTWAGPDDPHNPRNWSSWEKWSAALTTAAFALITPMSSTMLSSSLQSITHDLHLGTAAETQTIFSIYVLSWGTGPLLLGPLSEVYGRVLVLQLSTIVFVAFSIASGLSRSSAELIIFRFISGLGGSAVLAVDDGLLSDMWAPDELGGVISLYSYLPLMSMTIGPITGAIITQYSTWRWAFYSLAIAAALASFVGIFLLRETYAPRLLRLKANKLRKSHSDPRYHVGDASLPTSLSKTLLYGFVRPLKMAFTQPVIVALALYLAYIWGLLYFLLSTFGTLWQEKYHESIVISSLNYLSLAIGLYLGTQIGASLSDKIYGYLKTRNNGEGTPEFRAPLMIISSPLIPIGCLWYGWSAQAHTHWIMPNIGVALFGIGGLVSYQGVQAYVLETYPRYAASAMAATTLARSVSGFVFPIFAPKMYQTLDYGWGNTLLAGVAIIFGFPAPVLLYFFGARLRARSKYSTDDITNL